MTQQGDSVKTLSHREAQLAMLDVLKQFDVFCRKHGLCYWLGYGTLLGAVRHQGFIPWDDDIDLCMPRKDYNQFLELMKTAAPKDQHLFHYSLKNTARTFNFAKFGRTDTFCHTPYGDLPWGISLDIFPIDMVDPGKIKNLNVLRKFMSVSLYGKTGVWRDRVKWIIYHTTQMLGRDRLYRAIRNWASSTRDDAVLVAGIEMGDSKIFSKFQITLDNVRPLHLQHFEGHTFPGPNNADLYLKRLYNEYWVVPNVGDQETHEATYVIKD